MRHHQMMRTTLDIDQDVLEAAKDLARNEGSTAGAVISRLARIALTTPGNPPTAEEPPALYGFRPFPKRGGIVTNDLIDQLREDDVG
jgi:hypothetical protein